MSRFADRYSGTQLRMLDALGYRLLERAGGGAAANDAGLPAAVQTEDDCVTAGQRNTAVEDRQAGPRAGTRLPQRIVIEQADAGAPLLAAIRAAAALAGDRGQLDANGDVLRIEVGGRAPEWRVALDALRGSARHKAALWRALRGMRALRSGGGGE